MNRAPFGAYSNVYLHQTLTIRLSGGQTDELIQIKSFSIIRVLYNKAHKNHQIVYYYFSM